MKLTQDAHNYKYIGKAGKHIYSSMNTKTKEIVYFIVLKGLSITYYGNIKEAQISLDKYLISKGKEPLYLKRKPC